MTHRRETCALLIIEVSEPHLRPRIHLLMLTKKVFDLRFGLFAKRIEGARIPVNTVSPPFEGILQACKMEYLRPVSL